VASNITEKKISIIVKNDYNVNVNNTPVPPIGKIVSPNTYDATTFQGAG
jgi:hypothetical protein